MNSRVARGSARQSAHGLLRKRGDMSAFIERITGSQVGGATQTLQTYELGSLLGVEERRVG
jgi:hypothetical protein